MGVPFFFFWWKLSDDCLDFSVTAAQIFVGRLYDMSDIDKPKLLPMWFFVASGILSGALLTTLSYQRHELHPYIFGIIAIVFFVGLGLSRFWMRANINSMRWILVGLIVIGILSGIVATMLDILHKR